MSNCPPYGGGDCLPPAPSTVPGSHAGVPLQRAAEHLPFTGGDVVGLVLLAFVLVALGAICVGAHRRFITWIMREGS